MGEAGTGASATPRAWEDAPGQLLHSLRSPSARSRSGLLAAQQWRRWRGVPRVGPIALLACGTALAARYVARGPRWRGGVFHQAANDKVLFGLSANGEVFYQRQEVKPHWNIVAGSPCGMIWGTPVDVDASTKAIWVICQHEFATRDGLRKEHFLFAKWGWSPENNHPWWHMMKGGDVAQLDADDDSLWGLDGEGGVLWKPAGNVGKHTRWERAEGPEEDGHGVPLANIAADNDANGTWLWALDLEGRVWLRGPFRGNEAKLPWSRKDSQGQSLWPGEQRPRLFKADEGEVWTVRDDGVVLRRRIDGACCVGGEGCWCREAPAPLASDVSDHGSHLLGLHFPTVHTKSKGNWTAQSNRWVKHLSNQDQGRSVGTVMEEYAFFARMCPKTPDACGNVNGSLSELRRGWLQRMGRDWRIWSWQRLKHDYSKCYGRERTCRLPLEHFGRFRDRYVLSAFCCARQLLTAEEDPDCTLPHCRAYDMTCPGSKLLTSDKDCTVYHSSDPGALILEMHKLARGSFLPLAGSDGASLSSVFDVNLYGTWTWVPDEIFQRFPWPKVTKRLFELVENPGSMTSVWVFRRKCTAGARSAVDEELKRIFEGDWDRPEPPDMDVQLATALRSWLGKLTAGAYSGRSSWHALFWDYLAVARLQREGYLTYPTTLEVVGRQQVGLPARFRDDWACMRQVSFLEQLIFIARHVQQDLSESLDEANFHDEISNLILRVGKYFDRLLEVGSKHDEGFGASSLEHGDESVIFQVLDNLFGEGVSHEDITSREVQRRACMDVAMWGNAGRHADAFRADTGGLIQPLVRTFFACFVPPEAVAQGTPLKAAILNSLKSWAGAVPS